MQRLIKTPSAGSLLRMGYGAMGLTFPGFSEEHGIAVLKYALSQVKNGEKLVINTSEHHGNGENLQLLGKLFAEDPTLSQKAFVAVKGAMSIFTPGKGVLEPDASASALRYSAEGCATRLHPHKVDVFELGRIDKRVPIEDAMRTLVSLQKEGLFDHIGLSECSADTLRRASAIAPIVTAEIELSPVTWEPETRKVLAAAAETATIIVAYSPIGRGLLTAASYDNIHPLRKKMFPRFSEDNFEHNHKLAQAFQALAKAKGVTPAQLSIAWVMAIGGHYGAQVVPIPGSSNLKRVEENFGALGVELNDEEVEDITNLAENAGIKGDRYGGATNDMNWG